MLKSVVNFIKLAAINSSVLLVLVFLASSVYRITKDGLGVVFEKSPDMSAIGGKRGENSVDPDGFQCLTSHPFFGFTNSCSPWQEKGFLKEHSREQNSEYADTGKFRLLVLGGSVASHLSRRTSLEELLNKQIEKSPRLKSLYPDGAIVMNTAQGGYKQPQQLNILNFLLVTGYRFDAVINVAGFNEIALPIAENYPLGISTSMPRKHTYTEYRDSLFFNPFSYYSFIRPIYNLLPPRLSAVIGFMNPDAAAKKLQLAKPYSFDLPPSLIQAHFDALNIYQEASFLSYQISSIYKIPYYEIMQPNQYVEGSKPMSNQESSVAINENHPYASPIKKIYQKISPGEFSIPTDNVLDARMLFKQRPEQLYSDDCCHLNSKGMKLLASYIARSILDNSKGDTHNNKLHDAPTLSSALDTHS